MIADLKLDSARWEAERLKTASGGRVQTGTSSRDANGIARHSNTPTGMEYRSSQTHQIRQHFGPTEFGVAAAPTYPPSTSGGQSGNVYDDGMSGLQYEDQQYSGQPAQTGYRPPQPDYPISQDGYYVHGGALRPEVSVPRQGRGIPVTQGPTGTVPRDPYASSTPTYSSQDPRYAYPQPPPLTGQQYPTSQQQQQPADLSYSHGMYS
jgi:hypothetical protein